jgi:hypothetical protein
MSQASAPVRVARETLWISSTAIRLVRVSMQTPQTAWSDVGDVRAADGGQAEESGELDGDHLRGRCGWDGDVDDRDVGAGVRMALAVDDLQGLPSWVIAVVLPVRAGPDRISPQRPQWALRLR